MSRQVSYVTPLSVAKLQIPPGERGRIIGKGGATIRELEYKTGASLRLKDDELSIRGSPAAVAEAKRLVGRMIGAGGTQIWRGVDEKTLAALASDEGMTYVRAIEYENNVEIDVGTRDITISSLNDDPDTAENVKSLLMKKAMMMLEPLSDRVPIYDGSKLGEIKADAELKNLQDQYGLEVMIDKDDFGVSIALTGPKFFVNQAKVVIDMICQGDERKAILRFPVNFLLSMDDDKWADFQDDVDLHVGERYEAQIQYGSAGQHIELSVSSASALAPALTALQEILIYYLPKQTCLFFVRPTQAQEWVVGRDMNQLASFQTRECTAWLNPNNATIWIAGEERAVERAITRLTQSLETWKETNEVVPITNSRVLGRLIGPGGENLRKLQDETGASIATNDAFVHVKGSSRAVVERGVAAVQNTIRDAMAQPDRSFTSLQSAPGSFPPTARGRGGRGGMASPRGAAGGFRGRGVGRGGRGWGA